ncbi:hypothetical protein BG842_01810 [Haladaptatus sp. W1]|uniref:hypothetical protein n=1 Tax=Haladaptatus sp. W1 TaxID=1897478 RepID=UPI000849E0CB|nr:hypothetical protein [Haladaptatus sp. W1]ODR81069.1 hypothetical protein BG842_01810 [Haladaptatus sp. W1]
MSFRPSSSRSRTSVGLLLLVLSFSVLGIVTVGITSATDTRTDTRVDDTRVSDCPTDGGAGNDVAWHLQRYGAGCERNDFVRFPAGEQIDRIGEPPWVPL